MKRYKEMAFDPHEWVDMTMTEYGTPPCVIHEMIHSMYGSMVPEPWIDEALGYLKTKLN